MGDTSTLPQHDDAGSVPEWSGNFTRITPRLGMTLVHLDDRSSPQFPAGWTPLTEPVFEGEAVIWLLTPEDAA